MNETTVVSENIKLTLYVKDVENKVTQRGDAIEKSV
jgi:hypothetical protein